MIHEMENAICPICGSSLIFIGSILSESHFQQYHNCGICHVDLIIRDHVNMEFDYIDILDSISFNMYTNICTYSYDFSFDGFILNTTSKEVAYFKSFKEVKEDMIKRNSDFIKYILLNGS